MSLQAPLSTTLERVIPASGAAVDTTIVLGEAPFDGTVTGVQYVPAAAITGADTNTRTLAVVNKGQAGTGTTSIASLALASGVNAAAADEKAVTLSGTAANLVVASGDVLEFTSIHAGSGLADPGGLARVTIART